MADSTRRSHQPEPGRPDRDFHERLLAASRSISFPETPDIATSVRRALDLGGTTAQPPAAPPGPPPSWIRHPAALAAAVALLLVAGIVLIPATRETVAGWLGVPGIQIQFTDDDDPTPTVAATPQPSLGLLLGTLVTLEDARQRVDFAIALPDVPGLGMPDEIYVRGSGGGDQVVYLYGARPGFPAAAETGIGLLLIQFEAPDDAFWGVKQVTGSNDVRVVRVNGADALWVGGSHQLLIAPSPDPITSTRPTPSPGDLAARPSANVLFWAANGVTYRIESSLSRQDSITLAESVTLIEPGTPTP
jgi:hypothetical protein